MATFWDEDFEAGFPPPGWTYTPASNSGQTFSITAAQFLSGTHSLQYNFTGDNLIGDGATLTRDYGSQTHVFWRWVVKLDTLFDTAHDNGFTKVGFFGGNHYPGILPYFQGGGGLGGGGVFSMHVEEYFQDVFPVGAHDFTPVGGNWKDGQWHTFEAEIQQNTPGSANGIYRVWIDGTLQLEQLNRTIVGPTPTSSVPSDLRMTGDILYCQTGYNHYWLDRVAAGNSARFGLVGGDTTPPTIQITGPTSAPTFITRTSPL